MGHCEAGVSYAEMCSTLQSTMQVEGAILCIVFLYITVASICGAGLCFTL